MPWALFVMRYRRTTMSEKIEAMIAAMLKRAATLDRGCPGTREERNLRCRAAALQRLLQGGQR